MEKQPRPVIQDWVLHLPFRMQSVLLCALRGPDGMPRECVGKQLTRHIRRVVLNDADPTNSFIKGLRLSLAETVTAVTQDIDQYNVHFIMHATHACEIIGYKHPEEPVGAAWRVMYVRLVESFHMKPESLKDLEKRLGFTEIG